MSSLTHAQKVAFMHGTPIPGLQRGRGLQVPVLQVGGGVVGLGPVHGADHRVVGVPDPQAPGVPFDAPVLAPEGGEPDQEALTRQELIQQRMRILEG